MKKVKAFKAIQAFSQKGEFLDKLKILVSRKKGEKNPSVQFKRVSICYVNAFTTKRKQVIKQ